MTETLSKPAPISSATVFAERHASLDLRPDWFRELQQQNWDKYLALPLPNRRNENWRFANLERIAAHGDYVPTPFEGVDAPEVAARSNRLKNISGRLIFVDDNLAVARQIDPELEAKGVIFTPLIEAIAKHPELVREHLLQQSPDLGSEKFEALHIALMRNGVFLYIPPEIEIKKPFVVYHWTKQDRGAIFPHTLFVTSRNAEATLLEFQDHLDADASSLIVANAHVIAEDGARPHHKIVQNWSPKSLSFQLNASTAGHNVNGKSIIINTGSQQARQEIHGRIFGSGSNVEMYSLNVPTGTQEFDQRTLQTHIGPHSRSDLLYKNALLDSARTIFSGLIIVEENAQQTDAYQTNNNLMLSGDAEANSLPGLEIKANDVKCSHGATTGQIDDSNMFYFLARGIPRKKAEELIVFGFFEEILDKFENEEVRDYVRDRVQHKFAD